MSSAKHHSEWLSLIEVSGPFLTMPVLERVFPHGLDAHDPEHLRGLRAAHEEWEDNQNGRRPSTAIHKAWIDFVFKQTLGLPDEVLTEGQAIPQTLRATVAEHGETLRPDLLIRNPDGDAQAGKPRLLVQTYPPQQCLEKPVTGRHWKASPATRMMELLHATDIRLGLVTNGEHWMLVDAPRNDTTGFASWYATLWFEEQLTLRAFRSLLDAHRFFSVAENETLEAMLAESGQNQQEVTTQLGLQVRRAVEVLIQSLDQADQDHGRALLAGIPETVLYESALTVMMRLVFLFSAEERELLLIGDPLYDQHYAVSTLVAQLQEAADQHGEEVLERRLDAWARLLSTFRAVYGGVQHERMRLPPYAGNLFNPDRFPFLEGRKAGTTWRSTPAAPLPANNRTVLHLLRSLQYLQMQGEARRLSFRALDIEQIGHVYEGLLDHTSKRAAEPILGLLGPKGEEPEIPLSELERLAATGESSLIAFLQEETGKSENALKKALGSPVEGDVARKIMAACGNDDRLFQRVRPFSGLVREDTFDRPVVIRKGSVYVTAGTDRRSSGTHYTPRSLTEPIVQYTLEPLVYEGPAEGKAKEEWKLKSARELLDLKICDMACGSGAFLVQACRYMSERLAEAWESAESQEAGRYRERDEEEYELQVAAERGVVLPWQPRIARILRITPFGERSTGKIDEQIVPVDADERMAYARRIVAQRCLYGVDKNPLAAEMAKLSLWLLTLAKDKPFTFLDHAIRCGDSLVGIKDLDQLKYFNLNPKGENRPVFAGPILEMVNEAVTLRKKIESYPANTVEDVQAKEKLLAAAEEKTARLRYAADLLISVEFQPVSSVAEKEALRSTLAAKAADYAKTCTTGGIDTAVRNAWGGEQSFHWPIHFPEVTIDRLGFDAFIGNPPFRASRYLSSDLGSDYLRYLQAPPFSLSGQADLCSSFATRTFSLINEHGLIGLILTKTIAEGGTRTSFLIPALQDGGKLVWVRRLVPWPGDAQVVVSLLVLARRHADFRPILDDKPVEDIDATLSIGLSAMAVPRSLLMSSRLVGKGVGLGASYFELDSLEGQTLRQEDNAHVRRFVSGSSHCSSADGWGGRMVFYFQDIPDEESLRQIPIGRVFINRVPIEKRIGNYWRYRRSAEALFTMLSSMRHCIIRAQTSSTWVFSFWLKSDVFDQTIIAFGTNCKGLWLTLNSSVHEAWVEKFGGMMKTDTTYSPSNCFHTFPLPYDPEIHIHCNLEKIADELDTKRKSILYAGQVGLTDALMRIHNHEFRSKDTEELRQLRERIDNEVISAYGWSDLGLRHGFYRTKQGVRFTISEAARREVLSRLLKLNHERYEEEVRQGLHEKSAKGARKAKATKGGSGKSRASMRSTPLFDTDNKISEEDDVTD